MSETKPKLPVVAILTWPLTGADGCCAYSATAVNMIVISLAVFISTLLRISTISFRSSRTGWRVEVLLRRRAHLHECAARDILRVRVIRPSASPMRAVPRAEAVRVRTAAQD